MTQQITVIPTGPLVAHVVAEATAQPAALQEITVYGHSTLLYWWPAWAFGFVIALLNAGQEKFLATAPGAQPSSALGLTYLAILLLLIVFTNVRLRGINSVVALLAVAFVAVLLAWFGWWDDIVSILPNLSARANMGFYLLFATGMLLVWSAAFFVFDRLTFWRVRPGQIVEQRLVGGGEQSYDTQGLLFERREQDLFRHLVLGLGAGDLLLKSGGARPDTITIPNVLFVDHKLKALQQLIAVKPDQLPTVASAA